MKKALDQSKDLKIVVCMRSTLGAFMMNVIDRYKDSEDDLPEDLRAIGTKVRIINDRMNMLGLRAMELDDPLLFKLLESLGILAPVELDMPLRWEKL